MNMMSHIRGTVGEVVRVHSDRGGEFLSRHLSHFLRPQLAWQTSTQGYDPNANGLAEAHT